jgi:hypothetical protein
VPSIDDRSLDTCGFGQATGLYHEVFREARARLDSGAWKELPVVYDEPWTREAYDQVIVSKMGRVSPSFEHIVTEYIPRYRDMYREMRVISVLSGRFEEFVARGTSPNAFLAVLHGVMRAHGARYDPRAFAHGSPYAEERQLKVPASEGSIGYVFDRNRLASRWISLVRYRTFGVSHSFKNIKDAGRGYLRDWDGTYRLYDLNPGTGGEYIPKLIDWIAPGRGQCPAVFKD